MSPVAPTSKITKLELTPLGPQPRGCPAEVKGSWKYLVGAHDSVTGLFDTLHVLRLKSAEESDARGRLSHDQTDQLRAAIVFTSAGLDACLRRLLRDALPTLVNGNSAAEGKFKHFVNEQLNIDKASRAFRAAVIDPDPRNRLIDMYIDSLTGSSLQGHKDLQKVRDALGIPMSDISDSTLEKLGPFFSARNEIAHELDLVNPTGRGTSSRRDRKMSAVKDQCDEALQQVRSFVTHAARQVKSAKPAAP
ncbi:hypothetical protein ACFY84_28665 [Streptomyces sp. NPDC012438]|uniref:hypothetical protein n=1 Tax=Streptomyces sp. NPDC012438 TaxID=3364833 RepID=UPI0036EEFEA4